MQYSEACSCFRRNPNTAPECDNVFKLAFPTLARKNLQPISPRNLCDRQKRDLHYTDEATDEDFQLFKEVRQWRPRVRREVEIGPFSRKNASRYCAERISETKIGKLCAKLGVDVQSLVDTCSDDVVVSTLLFVNPTDTSKAFEIPMIPYGCVENFPIFHWAQFDVGLTDFDFYVEITFYDCVLQTQNLLVASLTQRFCFDSAKGMCGLVSLRTIRRGCIHYVVIKRAGL